MITKDYILYNNTPHRSFHPLPGPGRSSTPLPLIWFRLRRWSA